MCKKSLKHKISYQSMLLEISGSWRRRAEKEAHVEEACVICWNRDQVVLNDACASLQDEPWSNSLDYKKRLTIFLASLGDRQSIGLSQQSYWSCLMHIWRYSIYHWKEAQLAWILNYYVQKRYFCVLKAGTHRIKYSRLFPSIQKLFKKTRLKRAINVS